MPQTLPNGSVVPNSNGQERISATGVDELRTLGASIDVQLGLLMAGRWAKPNLTLDTDLDTVRAPGAYSSHNAAVTNSLKNAPPDATAGVLEVIQATASAHIQRFSMYSGGLGSKVWTRRTLSASAGTWTAWELLATTSDIDRAVAAKADAAALSTLASEVSAVSEGLDGKAAVGHTHTLATLPGVSAELNQRLDTRFSGLTSAYDVAVADGFTGTITEWLASLQGPRGDEGPYGGTEVTDPQIASYVTTETETSRVLNAAYRRGVSVAELDAVGDGSTSDTAALNAAVARAAVFKAPVYVPAGVYRMTGPLTLSSGTALEMDTGAVLDFSDNTGSTHVVASGAIATEYVPITAGAQKGSYQITVDPTGLAVDDWIRVASQDIYDAANTTVPYGELVQVREVDADTVTLWTPLCDTYTKTPTMQRVEMIRDVSITGGTIRGNFTPQTNRTGIHGTFVENMRVDRVRMEGIDNRHIAFDSCVNAWASELDDYWALTTGTAYGVSFLNMCRDSGVTRSRFRYVRHAFSTNNAVNGHNMGIVRRITFSYNVVESTSRALGGSMGGGTAIDTHGAAEDIDILYNIVNGSTATGINLECRSGRIIGNRLTDCVNGGITVHNETDLDGDFTISGNTMVRTGAGFYGIYVYAGTRGGEGVHRGVVITGNSIEDSGHGIGVGRTGLPVRDYAVTITGNSIRNVTGRGIYIAGVDALTEGDNTVANAEAGCLYVTQVSHASLGPSAFSAAPGFTGWVVHLDAVTWSRYQPGAIYAETGTGIRITATCQNVSVGPYSHVHAATLMSNAGGSTVSLAA